MPLFISFILCMMFKKKSKYQVHVEVIKECTVIAKYSTQVLAKMLILDD